ncbi:glycosyltransferase family 4 protein [Rickettsiella grylli]|nr:glycosyltransferase family 1 protein [Rickettsiella grylli]
MMKIIINGHSIKAPLTGIGLYTRQLFQGLKHNGRITELICIPENTGTIGKDIKKNSFSPIKKMIKSLPGTYTTFNQWRSLNFRRKTRLLAQKNFIYHEPSYILHPYAGPKVCTVHDLSHIHYPQYHPRERVKFLSKQLAKSIASAQHIITGSNFIRNEIINFFNVSPDKISVVYHGVSKRFQPYTQNELNPIARYQLTKKKYLLSVATREPRKNIKRLLHAYSRLPASLRKQYPLVLIGSKGWNSVQLEKLIDKQVRKKEIYDLGYVPDLDLPYLYAGAAAFLYLSIYEGFGLPILEALASGIPVIASNVSSIPEVMGTAGCLVNPFDVMSITERLNEILNDPILRDHLKQKGIVHAAQFSWETCITNTIGVYESILASSSVTVLRS